MIKQPKPRPSHPPIGEPFPLPGLVNGNLLALKMSDRIATGYIQDGSAADEKVIDYCAFLGVRRASVRDGNITYWGESLFYSAYGEPTLIWRTFTQTWVDRCGKGELLTWGQLSQSPPPPYYQQVHLEPQSLIIQPPVMEVKGLLLIGAGYDQQKRYWLTFRGDWCPLFRDPNPPYNADQYINNIPPV
jgi:hypothetical protein